MRIVVISETFEKNMGYIQNSLTKALAAEGHEVHLLTTRLAPNYLIPEFRDAYGSFVKQGGSEDSETLDGYQIHYLPHERRLGYTRLPTLSRVLRRLEPDAVQALHVIGWLPLEAARAKLSQRFGLFTAAHYTRSVFQIAQETGPIWNRTAVGVRLTRTMPGRLISLCTSKCYAATPDCAEVAIEHFGVQENKVTIHPLGVDTDLFRAPSVDERRAARASVRARFGIAESDLLLLYTGRFTTDKNPLLLAAATARLRAEGVSTRALFVGGGPQRAAIAAIEGCATTDFVPNTQLPAFFWAADIGVWPTQESLSMLDAAASGLPIIVNHTITASERFEGNGRTYRLGDVPDLAEAIKSLQVPALRRSLGTVGASKMRALFSWRTMARKRLEDYEQFAR
jgi:glycosyltransferase involved in cell wall biosynthesis